MSGSNKTKNKKKTRRDGVIPIHFLRIVIENAVKFHLPKQFVRHYGNGLSESVLIQAPTGPLWKVELERGDGQIWFENGWQEFVDYFSLKVGSSMVFRYEGDSRFNVLFIFDPDALESKHLNDREANRDVKLGNPKVEVVKRDNDSARMMSKTPASKEMRIQEVIEIVSDDDSAGIIESNIPTYKKRGIQDKRIVRRSGRGSDVELKIQMSRKYGSKNGASPAEEASRGASASQRCKSLEGPRKMQSLAPKREARALGKDANLKSKRPFFKLTMKPSHFKRLELYIPVKFRRRYLTGNTGDVMLQNMDGKTWSLSYRVYEGYSSVWFYGGWKEFLLDNDLQVGDTCRFELQKGLKIRFIVTISRVVEDANRHLTAARGGKTGRVGHKRRLITGSDQFESGCTSKYEGITPPGTSKESNAPRKKIKTKHGMFAPVMPSNRGSGCSIRRLLSKASARAFERASKFKSNHPSFCLVITAKVLQKTYPSIPTHFCKEYLKPVAQDAALQMKDKFWSLRLTADAAKVGRFGLGWRTFASENNLQPGDVCVFQMVNANPIVFQVTISSGSSG